jgi:hypothetical protein
MSAARTEEREVSIKELVDGAGQSEKPQPRLRV